MTISASVWSAQHPNAGQNIQHTSSKFGLIYGLTHNHPWLYITFTFLSKQVSALWVSKEFKKGKSQQALNWNQILQLSHLKQKNSDQFQLKSYWINTKAFEDGWWIVVNNLYTYAYSFDIFQRSRASGNNFGHFSIPVCRKKQGRSHQKRQETTRNDVRNAYKLNKKRPGPGPRSAESRFHYLCSQVLIIKHLKDNHK